MFSFFRHKDVNEEAVPAKVLPKAVCFDIAGVMYHVQPDEKKCGWFDGMLIPEPENPHDPNAIKICRNDGMLVGYIRRCKTGYWRILTDGKEWPCSIHLYGIRDDDTKDIAVMAGDCEVKGVDFSKVDLEMLQMPGVAIEDEERVRADKERLKAIHESFKMKKEVSIKRETTYYPDVYAGGPSIFSLWFGGIFSGSDDIGSDNTDGSLPYNSGSWMSPTDSMDHELFERQMDDGEYMDFRW